MRRLHPLHLLLVLLLAVGLPAGLAACGGDDENVDEILAQTFGEDKDVESGRLDLGLRLDLQGVENLQGPVAVRLQGPFESTGETSLPKFDFDLSLQAGGQSFTAGAVSTGDKGFVTFQGTDYAVPDRLFEQFKQGYARSAQQSGKQDDKAVSFKALGIDPRRWLRDPQLAGEEEVGGADTHHITAGIDVPKFLEDVNTILGRADRLGVAQKGQVRELSEADRRRIAQAIQRADLELWTGKDDKVLRRLTIGVRLDVPEADRGRAGGLEGGRVAFSLQIGDINDDVEIEAPEDTRPLEQLLGGLGAGGAGAQGGQQQGGAAPQGGEGQQGGAAQQDAPPPAGASPEYLECAQNAAGDIAKLQECADLLN